MGNLEGLFLLEVGKLITVIFLKINTQPGQKCRVHMIAQKIAQRWPMSVSLCTKSPTIAWDSGSSVRKAVAVWDPPLLLLLMRRRLALISFLFTNSNSPLKSPHEHTSPWGTRLGATPTGCTWKRPRGPRRGECGGVKRPELQCNLR